MTLLSSASEESIENPTVSVQNVELFGVFGKPNAIVRPVRRMEPNEESMHTVEMTTVPVNSMEPTDASIDMYHFTKHLEVKLKNLQSDKRMTSKINLTEIANRPRFVTIVPTGKYLPPMKELPMVAPKLRTYAFCSIPKLYAQRINKENEYPISGIQVVQPITPYNKFNKSREAHQPQNIMYDKRVVRGSNFNQLHSSTWNPNFAFAGLLSGKGDTEREIKEAEARRRQHLRRRYVNRNPRGIIGTPPPVKGRRHEQIQTEKYLEELFDHPPEKHVECQTELFLESPRIAPYASSKTGIDVQTEIEPGDLIDFDVEVEPIVETLVNVAVEQAVLEVLHEEQVAEMRKQQQVFLALREAELAEVRRLEADELRLQTEKERRQRLEQISDELDRELKHKAAISEVSQKYIENLIPGVLRALDERKLAVLDDKLKPWLAQEVASEVGQMVNSKEVLENIIREILEYRADACESAVKDEASAIDVSNASQPMNIDSEEEEEEEKVSAIDEPKELQPMDTNPTAEGHLNSSSEIDQA